MKIYMNADFSFEKYCKRFKSELKHGKLLKLTKKEVEDFDIAHNCKGKKILLKHYKWLLHDGVYYEKRHLNTKTKVIGSTLTLATALGVSTGIILPKWMHDQYVKGIEQDIALVDKCNEVLNESGTKFPTCYDALSYIYLNEGIDIPSLKTTNKNSEYAFDLKNNCLVLLDKNSEKIVHTTGKEEITNSDIWRFTNTYVYNENSSVKDSFGTYIVNPSEFKFNTKFSNSSISSNLEKPDFTVYTGFDVGTNINLNVVYKSSSRVDATPIIRTFESEFTVQDSSNYGVIHLGSAKKVDVSTSGTYVENGVVEGNLTLTNGTLTTGEDCDVNTIVLDSSFAKVKVTVPNSVGTVQYTDKVNPETQIDTSAISEEEFKPTIPDDPSEPTTKFTGGMGTRKSPFAIDSLEQFNNMTTSEEGGLDKWYRLISDIDFKGASRNPIGNYANPFTGGFDGNLYSLKNIVIVKPDGFDVNLDGIGLFGNTSGTPNSNYTQYTDIWQNDTIDEEKISEDKYDCVIKNLFIDNINVTETDNKYDAGGLVGIALDSYISDVYVTNSKISCAKTVGGIVGALNATTIFDCVTDENTIISGTTYNAGGIVGATAYKRSTAQVSTGCQAVVGCINKAKITSVDASGYCGGIIGMCQGGTSNVISKCFNYGDIVSDGTTAGGIAGQAIGMNISSNCHNYGNITITDGHTAESVGGVAARGSGYYINCSNNGKINGSAEQMAGILARFQSTTMSLTFTSCYNYGELNNTNPSGQTANIVTGTSSATFKDLTFATTEELNNAISSTSATNLEFINVTVTDHSGTLKVPSSASQIISDKPLASDVKFANNAGRVTLDIPEINVTINNDSNIDLSNLYLTVNNDNSIVTINEGVNMNTAIVTGEGSKIYNSGTLSGKIGLDGGATIGINNGTCRAVSLGHNYGLGTGDKKFTNNGTIATVSDTGANEHVIFCIGGSTCNIDFTNNGTISYEKTGASGTPGYLFYSASTGNLTFTCNAGSKFITKNSGTGGRTFISSRGENYIKYSRTAEFKVDDTSKSFEIFKNARTQVECID